ncbi:GNAT family N-acetyltransferase [Micromonospora sp. URMC 103]|uniref:GNAT family N-acetyltransferase n=1 Tax=Micromonospora sp. URMC 103 TaxID=3423406 RepID=UPI003F1B4525
MTIRISGLGLHLREWTDDDLPVMVELFDDPDVAQWTPLASPFDLTAARNYLDQARTRRAGGHSIQLAITTNGHTPLGEILLFPTNPTGRTPHGRDAELAYAVGSAHRRKGLTSRAVQLMTTYAYQLGKRRVILRIDPHNAASIAVARAAGFELTGDDPLTRRSPRPLLTWDHRSSTSP